MPFNSILVNLLITSLAVILCPLVMLVAPFCAAFIYGMKAAADAYNSLASDCRCICPISTLVALLVAIIVIPIYLVLAAIAAGFTVVFGSLAFWFCCMCYICIVIKNTLKFW